LIIIIGALNPWCANTKWRPISFYVSKKESVSLPVVLLPMFGAKHDASHTSTR
jgi:hypothetical protein